MLVYSYLYQKSSVGTIRVKNPLSVLDEWNNDVYWFDLPGIPPREESMAGCSTMYLRGFVNVGALEWIKYIHRHKKFPQCKFVLDNDDLIWDFKLPEWNNYKTKFDNAYMQFSKEEAEWIGTMDGLTFSTPYLRDYVKAKFDPPGKMTVVPNAVKRSEWFCRRVELDRDISTPRFVYMASKTHYSNEKKMLGDWTEELVAWFKETVRRGRIELSCIGGLPWFFEDCKDRIDVHGWTRYSELPGVLREIRPHFSINPLAECDFNRAKSDVKKVESAALDIVCIGTDFDDSPYTSCEAKISKEPQISELDSLLKRVTDKNFYNSMLANQRDWMERDGRWLECEKHLSVLRSALLLPEAR